jgi:hypothetical protein
MKTIALLLALALVLASPLSAQEASNGAPEPPEIPPGSDVITPMTQGDRAPYTGMLLNTDTAIRWTMRLSWFRNELRLTLDGHTREIEAIQASHDRELARIRESYEREVTGLRADLREQATTFSRSQEQPWFNTFTFGLIVGLVGAGLLVGAAAWALSSI